MAKIKLKIEILQEFILKTTEFIIQNRSSITRSDTFTKSSLRLSTTQFINIRDQIANYFNEKSPRKHLIVEVLEICEGCQPLLLERWNFIHTSTKIKSSLSYKKRELDVLSGLRCLMAGSLTLPSSYKPKSSISINIKKENIDLTFWDPVLTDQDILYFPSQKLNFEIDNIMLETYIEYYTLPLKPRITRNSLGIRQRLVSFDNGEFENKDKQGIFNRSFESTEASPGLKAIRQSIINSESFFEENEAGFRLMSYDYKELSFEESENEFANNSFEMEFENEILENESDSVVPLYLRNCDKLKEVTLFNGNVNTYAEILRVVSNWKNKT